MRETARLARNAKLLGELAATYQERFRIVLARCEQRGYRIRAQEAYRSPERQLELYHAGFSERSRNGKHTRNLALDVVDDNRPLDPTVEFMALLAVEAWAVGLQTGVLWKLPANLVFPRLKAIQDKNLERLVELLRSKRGFDPLHIEVP